MVELPAVYNPNEIMKNVATMFIKTIWDAYSVTPKYPLNKVIISYAHHSIQIINAFGIPKDKY
jgi:hypothetical protein